MTSDLEEIEWALTTMLGQGLELMLTLVAAMATVFFLLDWRLGLASLVVLPLFVPAGLLLGPPSTRASLQRQSDLGVVATELQENLGGQFVVRSFSLERQSMAGFARVADQLLRSSVRLTFISSIYGLTTSSLGWIVQMGALGVGGWLVIEGQISLGTLIAYVGLLSLMITPVQSIATLFQVVQQATGALIRVDELVALPDERPSGAGRLETVQWDLEFDDVSFSHVPGLVALDGVSFRIPAGSRFAIVGPSGSGKSTLVRLLLRFEEPDSGAYRIDGIDSRQVSPESLRQHVAVVPQDDFLFNISVRDNIRLGRPDASEQEYRAAVSAAALDGVEAQLPDGLDTYVGERGAQLSGGQRQRVALARALLRRPSVLILDEATSALDTQTESAIYEALRRLDWEVTVVMVTHRLASVRDADWVVVVDAGRVVEQGAPAALLAAGGLYRALWESQQGSRNGVETEPGAQDVLDGRVVPNRVSNG
jgi:ABC-type multidrug transport system fused ATPase/permease subunit